MSKKDFPISRRRDLKEALTLLRVANDYGVRQQMGDEWCYRLDALLKRHPTKDPEVVNESSVQEGQGQT